MAGGDSDRATKAVSGKFSSGVIVTPGPPLEVAKEEGPAALLLAVLIVVGGLILIVTGLVLYGKLDQEWLIAITADSEAGVVLITIYLIYYIEISRDRREREKERREKEEKEHAAAEVAKSDTSKQMRST